MQAPIPQRNVVIQPPNAQQQSTMVTQQQSYYNPCAGYNGGYGNSYLANQRKQQEEDLRKKVEKGYHDNYTNLVKKVGKAMGDCEEVIEENIQHIDQAYNSVANPVYSEATTKTLECINLSQRLIDGNPAVETTYNNIQKVRHLEGAKVEGVNSLIDYMVKSRDIIYSYHEEEMREKRQQQQQPQNSYSQAGFSNGIQLCNNPSGAPVNIDDMQVPMPSATGNLTNDMATERRNMFLRAISNNSQGGTF